MTGLPVEKRKVTEYVQNQLLKRTLTAVGFAKYARCTSPEEARLRIIAAIGRFKRKDKFDREEAWLEFWSQYMTMKKLRRSGREQMSRHIEEETAALLNDQPRQTKTNITAIVADGDDDEENMESDDESYITMSEETETDTIMSRESSPPVAVLSELASNFELAYKRRNSALDTPISEARTLESVLFAVGMQAADRECLVHSWIVGIGEDWVKSLLTEAEQASLRKLWIEGRTGASLLDNEDMTWFRECDVLSRCEAELTELEEMFAESEEADPRTLYLHLATKPLIRDGEDPIKHEKLFGLRRVLLDILQTWWRSGDIRTYNEAAVFANLWGPIFDSLKARGYDMTAMDEPIPASKARKLLTYPSRKNVSGLQADRAWVTKTGYAIVWGEGKRRTWIEDIFKAEEARHKAKKGAKDCAEYTNAKMGRNVETYASVWLGAEWELYCCVALPSGACIIDTVMQLTMPRAAEGFLHLTHLLRRVLAWLTLLERQAKELARPAVRRKTSVQQLMSAATPIKKPQKGI
ncbi:hypothetical protein HDU88_005403 [Geranomyces variabilis]|nr:hypothetical protein HDU88_005403 [Geranomyces variabilis]